MEMIGDGIHLDSKIDSLMLEICSNMYRFTIEIVCYFLCSVLSLCNILIGQVIIQPSAVTPDKIL